MNKLSKMQESYDYQSPLEQDDTDIIEALEAEFDNVATNCKNNEIHKCIGDFIESPANMAYVAHVLLQDNGAKDALREFYVDYHIDDRKAQIEREMNDLY